MARPQRDAVSDDPLLKSEEWLRLAEQGSPMGLWYWNEDSGRVFWDEKACEMFGVSPGGEKTLETFYSCLHPDDRERVAHIWRHQLENGLPYDLEYRALRPDGSIRWIHALGSGYHDETGKPTRMVGVVFDVTERRSAERERLELSGRLINAQEEERRHLARELHDDFSQRISLLSIELQQVAEMIDDSAADASVRLRRSTEILNTIGHDLHSLSHRLHSSTLEVLGLVSSSQSLCREFARQHAIAVDFAQEDVPPSVPADAALCLFRILQEGLRNVGRHSGASQVHVTLRREQDAIALVISDNGVGFEPARNVGSTGIGIQSMRERARMVGGTLEVRSRPMQGTTISVSIPSQAIIPGV